jgi:hypothetical protein
MNNNKQHFSSYLIQVVGLLDFSITQVGPKLGFFVITVPLIQCFDGTQGTHIFCHAVGLGLFIGIGRLSIPEPYLTLVGNENKGISLGQGVLGKIHLCERHALLSTLDAVQMRRIFGRFNDIKSRLGTTFHVRQIVIKVRLKEGRLVSLDLTMLHGLASQKVVGFDHLVRGSAVLILRRFGSNPNVYIVEEGIAVTDSVRVQDNVRVPSKELSFFVFRPRHDMELLNSPDFQSRCLYRRE